MRRIACVLIAGVGLMVVGCSVDAPPSEELAATHSNLVRSACSSDGQCNPGNNGSGLICSFRRCVAGCRSDEQCPGNSVCMSNGQCGGAGSFGRRSAGLDCAGLDFEDDACAGFNGFDRFDRFDRPFAAETAQERAERLEDEAWMRERDEDEAWLREQEEDEAWMRANGVCEMDRDGFCL